ncbi:MAG: LysM peptidoglycan-binding domain-containing protein [Verrucomicrobiales bacterium]
MTFLLSLATGCFQFSSDNLEEEKDPNFIEAKKRVSSLDYQGAIEYFEKALQANPRSAAAHFELGVLYSQKGNDYGAAIYHFQRHLQLRPNSPMAEVVKSHITACKLELAKTVSFAVVNREVQRDLNRLTQTNTMLKQQLEATVAELQSRPEYVTNFVTNTVVTTQYVAQASAPDTDIEDEEVPAPQARRETRRNETTQRPVARVTTPTGARQAVRPAPPSASRSGRISYTVKKGETFSSIARNYGIPMQRLTAANPRIQPSRLKAGQVIVIPMER